MGLYGRLNTISRNEKHLHQVNQVLISDSAIKNYMKVKSWQKDLTTKNQN